jgi:hypothetical protein
MAVVHAEVEGNALLLHQAGNLQDTAEVLGPHVNVAFVRDRDAAASAYSYVFKYETATSSSVT